MQTVSLPKLSFMPRRTIGDQVGHINMGRVKLATKKIENATNRQLTFSKRHKRLLKKAYELSVLCDIEMVVITFSPSGKLTSFCRPTTTVEDVLQRFLDTPSLEQTKRRNENLELLEEIDHLLRVEPEAAEQSDLAAKQRKIEHLRSRIQQLQPLEDLIRARIEQSGSIAELNQLEDSIKNALLQVQDQKHVVQSMEGMKNLKIEQHFHQHFHQPASQNPGEHYPMRFAGPSNAAGTSNAVGTSNVAGTSNAVGTSLPQVLESYYQDLRRQFPSQKKK